MDLEINGFKIKDVTKEKVIATIATGRYVLETSKCKFSCASCLLTNETAKDCIQNVKTICGIMFSGDEAMYELFPKSASIIRKEFMRNDFDKYELEA